MKTKNHEITITVVIEIYGDNSATIRTVIGSKYVENSDQLKQFLFPKKGDKK